MDLPKRKATRLSGYDYSSPGAYFITICTKNKLRILGDIVGDDAHIVPNIKLSPYGMVVEKHINGITGIDKYVIMPNHIHLIIVIEEAMPTPSPPHSIPQLVKSFKTLVTKQIGFSLWQRSFHDHIIRDEHDYEAIWEYIDTNPLKWKQDCFY